MNPSAWFMVKSPAQEAMPTPKKISTVNKLTKSLQSAKSVVFADYRGLSTAQLENLRQKIESAGGNFSITKNTLLDLALKQALPKIPKDPKLPNPLTGPTATLFSFEDEITPIKALTEFIKKWELPQIKGGLLSGEFISTEKINLLALLPPREQLLAQLTAQINAPRAGLVWTLCANFSALTQVLQQIAKSCKNNPGQLKQPMQPNGGDTQ